MSTLAEFMILSGADNRPPMLKKHLTKRYEELSATKKIQADCDLKETNIILQGLPSDVYSLVSYHRVAKDLWEIVQLLMQDLFVCENMEAISAQVVVTAKLPVLNPNEFELWKMRIEQYFLMTDYAL
ncbi:hypothetical protein Tco_0485259 [Tanacetum coccineum]